MKKVSIFSIIIVLLANMYGCSEKILEKKEETITLTMWHIWTQKSDNTNGSIVESVIEEWNKNNPKIQIKCEIVENERYKTKIKTAMATNELPDIFFSWGSGFSKPFVDAEKVLNLNEYLNEEIKNKVKKGMFENVEYNGGIYGLPITLSIGTFYYNKKLFEDNNVKVPQNYDELLQSIKTFSKLGIIPLGASGTDKWTSMLYYDILALQDGGIEGVKSALNGRNYDLLLKTAYRMKELSEAGAFKEEGIDLTRDELEMKFKSGQVAMYYTGNWFIGDLENSTVKGDIAIGNFPINNYISKENVFLGGSTDYLMVSNNSKYKDESVEAIKYIAENVSRKFSQFGTGLPAWQEDKDHIEINELSKYLKDLTKDSSYFLYWDIYLGEEKGNIHKNLVDNLINGIITPEEFADIMNNL